MRTSYAGVQMLDSFISYKYPMLYFMQIAKHHVSPMALTHTFPALERAM